MGVGDRTSTSDDNNTAMKNGRGGGGVAIVCCSPWFTSLLFAIDSISHKIAERTEKMRIHKPKSCMHAPCAPTSTATAATDHAVNEHDQRPWRPPARLPVAVRRQRTETPQLIGPLSEINNMVIINRIAY